MKNKRILWFGVLGLLCVAMAWPLWTHFQAKARLAAYRAQLAASGEKLKLSELTPAPTAEGLQDLQTFVWKASSVQGFSVTAMPPAMRLVAPGRAMVVFQQEELPRDESTNLWPFLREEVLKREAALIELRTALPSTNFVFGLDYSQGAMLLLPHLARIKGLTQAFVAAAAFHLHEGSLEDAYTYLQAITELTANWDREPIIISELVRVAIAAMILNSTWEALQARGWTDAQLEALQSTWQRMDFFAQAEGALGMERVTIEDYLRRCREDPQYLNSGFAPFGTSKTGFAELVEIGEKVLSDPAEGLKLFTKRYPGYFSWKHWGSYEDELVNAQVVQAALETMREAKEGPSGPALQQLRSRAKAIQEAHPEAGKVVAIGAEESLQRFVERVIAMDLQRSLLVTAIGLKRHHLKHGAYPATLNDLDPVPEKPLPLDPVDRRPLRYRLTDQGEFILYSVGMDGQDNGGDATLPTKDEANSVGRRQWWKARDAVWLLPASREQVQHYYSSKESRPGQQ